MGQRHQIYIRLPKKQYSQSNNPNNRPAITVGLHHQWLYGRRAVLSLAQALKFLKLNLTQDDGNIDCKYIFNPSEAADMVKAVYQVDIDEGYYHRVHLMRDNDDDSNWSNGGRDSWYECCQRPEDGDNNDGITVIDLSGKQIKYAFLSVRHLEGEIDPEVGKPMSALEYFNCYYPKATRQKELKNSKPEHKADNLAFFLSALEACKYAQEFKVLTRAELKKIFPKSELFKGGGK